MVIRGHNGELIEAPGAQQAGLANHRLHRGTLNRTSPAFRIGKVWKPSEAQLGRKVLDQAAGDSLGIQATSEGQNFGFRLND